ncbi:hypothetical protein LguiB_024447 [Lonicera macranthoides]
MGKLKQTFNCFSSCSSSPRRPLDSPSSTSSSISDDYSSPGKVSTMWIKTRDHDFPEIKDKCLNVFNRICNHHHHHHHRRYSSENFKYDPLSYALNFENGSYDDEARFRNFSSRLPASPAINPMAV